MAIGVAQCLASIMYFSCIEQSVKNVLVSFEDGAVLVQFGYADFVGNVFKGHKILGKVSTKIVESVTVVINQPTVLNLYRCRSFHHLARKWLRGF